MQKEAIKRVGLISFVVKHMCLCVCLLANVFRQALSNHDLSQTAKIA